MFTLSISSLSTVYVQVPVSAMMGGSSHDPTGDTVKMAFMQGTLKPDTPDWHDGSWDTLPGPTYLAQCLVGPHGGVTPGVGTHTMWVQVTDDPEQPTDAVGFLTIE